MRRRLALLVAPLVIAGLVLTGCTDSSTAPTASATPTPTATIADPALRPVLPASLDQASAKAETERLADAIQALIIPTSIVYVDNHSVLVNNTGKTGDAWGVLRTITLKSAVDPSQVAESVIAVLEHSGWVLLHNTTDSGTEVIALASGTKTKDAWYLLVSADASKVGQSVVTVQLESPAIAS